MEFIDTHCHLQFSDFKDPAKIVRQAQEAGVTKLICVGTTLADSQRAIDLAAGFSHVWATVGTHPHEAKALLKNDSAANDLKQQVRSPKVVAVGEIGLDFYKNYSPPEDQKKTLRLQIESTLDSHLPFVFHVRDAWEDFWQIFDSYPGLRGVIHSFSAHTEQLDQILGRNLYVGLNGIMTFTSDSEQLEAAKLVPLDKLLLETDAPFLTPKPFRGDICEPKHIAEIAEFLAELRGESLPELAAASTKNATALFRLGPTNG